MTGARERASARIAFMTERFRDAVRLAQLASLAVRIEPHLIRRLRRDLLRDVDVGAEADLWFSQLVDSRGVDAIVLDRDVAAVLREQLAVHPRLDEVIAILVEVHRDEPSTITLEERVNALAVKKGRAALVAIDDELRAAIVAMRESDARAREIARWFLRAAPRLHPIVQECPNAIALLLSASMLLGRRSPAEVPETKTSLRDFGWVVSPGTLAERIDVGVERLHDGLRFVDIAGQTASGGTPQPASIGRLSIPRAEPRLVEVAWQAAGRLEQRVVEATPDRVVMLDADAAGVRIVTLAGDEYEIVSVAGTETSPPDHAVDLAPYRAIVEACVQVRTLKEPRTIGTAVRVHAEYVFTAREPFGRERPVTLVEGGDAFLCAVVPMPDYDELIAIDSARGGSQSVSLATTPFTAEQQEPDGPLEQRTKKAIVIGYDGDRVRGVEGDAEIDDFTGGEFRVLVTSAQPWFSGLNGGPVIIDGRVRGIVNAVHVPRMGESAILSVIGAVRIQDLLRRVLEQKPAEERREVLQEGGQQSAAASADAPEPPVWLLDVCVAIHRSGDDGVLATGLVVSDRLVVSTAAKLREAGVVSLVTPSRSIEARVLHNATSGSLVFLGVSSSDRFETTAPLIRPRTRVRTPSDPPDPVDAMLVVARDGLRTLSVPNAQSAGVVKARDPDGSRFEVVVSDRIVPFAGFKDGILVWGDVVAGIVVPSSGVKDTPTLVSNVPLTRLTAEVISVNAITDGIEGATEALERLTPLPSQPRVLVLSTSDDLASQRRYVEERVRAHDMVPILSHDRPVDPDRPPPSSDDQAAGDLVVLIVGPEEGALNFALSAAYLAYNTAIRQSTDVIVFLWSSDSHISDPAFRSWREELKKRHPVQYFSASLDSMRVDEAITAWKEQRREREHQPSSTAPSGYHYAKVVICGPAYKGKSSVLSRIPGLRSDKEHGGTRGVLPLDSPQSAPGLHAGIVFVESSSDENWPLVLDLEDASLAVIVLTFESGIEAVANAEVSRVRAAHATVPVLIALVHSNIQEEVRRSVLSQLSQIVLRDFRQRVESGSSLQAGRVLALSIQSNEGMESLVWEILQRVEWNSVPPMAPGDFDALVPQAETIFAFRSGENITRLSSITRSESLARLGRLLGERAFVGEDILIRQPAIFERVVLGLIGPARQQIQGLPAVRLKDVREDPAWSSQPDAVIRAVANDLARRHLAIVVQKTTDAVLVLPALLEAANEISVPSEADRVLRAQWTGTGRDVFIEVLVDFAYARGNTVEAGWQRSLSRGTGRVKTEPPLYIQVTETGEVAELVANVGDRSDVLKVDEATRQLREVLQQIMTANASLSIDAPAP